jgi:hypothetical protein
LTASTQPYIEHVINGNTGRWAQVDQGSVNARISIESSAGSQSVHPVVVVPNTNKPRLTMIDEER